ncbi:hypothetical protein H5410_054380 [Solanum commersonii]|uniref:TIR domain-containing protein n=1 Tax=Solanum commersonii TaxID=4109 RepID=A0A9J5WHC6_SOLCO|nr:hypothetical protein H5410_054380 [Solanum commersonii]
MAEGLRSLEILDLSYCNLIDGGLPEDIGCLSSLKELNLNRNNFERLPQSIAQLGSLRFLDLSECMRLTEFLGVNMAEGPWGQDIEYLSSLKYLYLNINNFECLPQSIAQLGSLQLLDLSYCKRLKELPGFTGMQYLDTLDLSFCNLTDGGLPEDIGSSFLKELNLFGNNFEHLPRSIAQLGALRTLDLSHCKRLTQLPEFPRQLHTICADWSNDWIFNSLFQNISVLQHDIYASDSLSLRVSTSMASSSSSASNSLYWKYDVFLSFRGEDTRRNFTSHLYQGLKNRGIFTFLDDKRLENGDSISEELGRAIEVSQVAVIVFSRNYAMSRWCLNELVKIMECEEKENGQTVIPIFCDVDPSHVRYQSKSFKEAFAKHESRYKDDVEGMQKVQGWRTALTAVANLKGYVVPNDVKSDADCIEHIVDQISSKCNTSVSYLQEVVGIDTQLRKVESLLQMEINDVRIVWIWGMGGAGKTTLAKTIFFKLSSKFKDVCFLENIKENKHGMYSLQNILLSKLLREKDNSVDDKEAGRSMLSERLRLKKVLVVLDDIDHIDQLDYLAKDLSWFGKGSRIIATTRDKRLIGENDVVFEVETLLDCDAIKLFNQYAFKEKVPNEHFKNLTLKIVSLTKGHPLALKVWGSSLHRMDITEWESALVRIKKNSDVEITENLKISYDGLEPEEQEIFLDIACFF